ncbi:MAG TPA: YerC/YecD family TrpR-related protein [Patescibacteria group bacterium]|nr:YerC/YecD family TrpR-related protein [Patescibacteria group bacterium]
MPEKWDNQQSESLFKAILRLKNLTEARSFFRDLLTPAEIAEFASRWEAAQLLAEQVPYVIISRRTGLSSTTIARIAKWLKQGRGGYRLMLQRLAAGHRHNSSFLEQGLG